MVTAARQGVMNALSAQGVGAANTENEHAKSAALLDATAILMCQVIYAFHVGKGYQKKGSRATNDKNKKK